MIVIIRKIIDKFVKQHDSYQLLQNDIEYLKAKIKDLTNLLDEKEQTLNFFKNKIAEIDKITKKLDARNATVKALKQTLKKFH